MKITLFILLVSFANLSLAQQIQKDTTIIGTYDYNIQNDKIVTKLTGYSVIIENQNNNSEVVEYFSINSIIESREISYKNFENQDSIKCIFVNESMTDSCAWSYDSLKREISCLYHSINSDNNRTNNWISEYYDTIINKDLHTTQIRYRIDKAKGYIDTCCHSKTVYTYKNGILVKEIESDNFGTEYIKKYSYNKAGEIKRINTKQYSYGHLEKEYDNAHNTKRLIEKKITFPKSLTVMDEKGISSLVDKYWDDFNKKKCRPDITLISEDRSTELRIVRGTCHSTNANAGRIIYFIRK